MPTTLPRTQITHTPTIRHALEAAAKRWPGQRPGSLLVHLIEEGARAIEEEEQADQQQRVTAIRALSTKYAGTYTTGYLEDVREGWNE